MWSNFLVVICFLHAVFARFKTKIYRKQQQLSNNCRKTYNMRTGTDIVNPFISKIYYFIVFKGPLGYCLCYCIWRITEIMSSFYDCKRVDWTEHKTYKILNIRVWNVLRTVINFHVFLFLEQIIASYRVLYRRMSWRWGSIHETFV